MSQEIIAELLWEALKDNQELKDKISKSKEYQEFYLRSVLDSDYTRKRIFNVLDFLTDCGKEKTHVDDLFGIFLGSLGYIIGSIPIDEEELKNKKLLMINLAVRGLNQIKNEVNKEES